MEARNGDSVSRKSSHCTPREQGMRDQLTREQMLAPSSEIGSLSSCVYRESQKSGIFSVLVLVQGKVVLSSLTVLGDSLAVFSIG